MKIYSCPEELPAPEPDYRNYNLEKEHQRELEHQNQLCEWLKERGYTGPRTGEILQEPFADGYALYMLADAPRQSCLIHLPYGDAWHSPNVQHLPKKEVLRRIDQKKNLASIFSR